MKQIFLATLFTFTLKVFGYPPSGPESAWKPLPISPAQAQKISMSSAIERRPPMVG